ncbi:NUDIX domain-containing protein [Anatilimnocola floriformis]|uniref:NUDIX domain-containing protein n=1 Tax=Anatilimnocola floriformis TaxID=2948575 RepID=UPI0020C27378|nr:NUDIX hydrolase [Anatilimnocola floriformis]
MAGVAAVVLRGEKFLVIRRSQTVRSPGKYCFPGGSIEAGETEAQAVVREFSEELGAPIRPIVRLWSSVTITHVALGWWQVALAEDQPLTANPLEVESIHWLTREEALALPELLPSNRDFYDAWQRGVFTFRSESGG